MGWLASSACVVSRTQIDSRDIPCPTRMCAVRESRRRAVLSPADMAPAQSERRSGGTTYRRTLTYSRGVVADSSASSRAATPGRSQPTPGRDSNTDQGYVTGPRPTRSPPAARPPSGPDLQPALILYRGGCASARPLLLRHAGQGLRPSWTRPPVPRSRCCPPPPPPLPAMSSSRGMYARHADPRGGGQRPAWRGYSALLPPCRYP
jgi:hypothetical protein